MEKKEFDTQTKGMACEFLTIGKLFKKGLQTTFTVGNAKSIDIFAQNQKGNKYAVQVKGATPPFQLGKEDIKENIIYVFIKLNSFLENEEYYIVKGSEILDNIGKFYISQYENNKSPTRPSIGINALKEYEGKWEVFDE